MSNQAISPGITQEQADQALGKILREAIAKALPLDFGKAVKLTVSVDMAEFGEVLATIEVLGTKAATSH